MILVFLVNITGLKKTIRNNLKKVYQPETDKLDQLCSEYIKKMARYIFEVLALGRLQTKTVDLLTKFTGLEKIAAVQQRGQGAILLCMHAGNWELLGCALAQKGYPLKAVVNSPAKDKFAKFLDRNREHNKVGLINIREENMYLATLRSLKKNELILIAADTGATDSDKNIELEFLGRKLPVASGWATIALRSKTPIIPVLCSSQNQEIKHHFELTEIIEASNFTEEAELLKKVLSVFEDFIRKNPTEWFLPLSESETKKTFGN